MRIHGLAHDALLYREQWYDPLPPCRDTSLSSDTDWFNRIGSAAMEAAMKLSRQYYLEKVPPEPSRYRFIARRQSYHGITLGALTLGGHEARRVKFAPMMADISSRVSPCFAYRGQHADEANETYVARLAKELDDEFIRVGPDTVCAFVAEPVVGAVGFSTAQPRRD